MTRAPSTRSALLHSLAPAARAGRAALETSSGLSGVPKLTSRMERTNYRGRAVSLRGGIGAAAGACIAALAPALTPAPRRRGGLEPGRAASIAAVAATTSAATAGLIDDLTEAAPQGQDGRRPPKGLKGHLGALVRGQVTTGVIKIAVIGAGAAVAGGVLAASRGQGGTAGRVRVLADAAGSAVVIASWANVMNLLDLRPGRSLKAAGLASAAVLALAGRDAGPSRRLAGAGLGVVAAALPEDLMETTMLGDTGANTVGALVGTALAAHPRRSLRWAAAGTGVALILASERVSFSQVISTTPVLAALDDLGRRPA
ncbi:hypothetical protein [Actinomyces slackii]|uniref:Glycosyl transferase family 4 n=1 Tax=Actinomyces slackii TaxID=52774 RepID=A0A448KEY1_9ACTO|nr:hypothetical protein [Actinomyces slackii]VEG75450.1 Uncharacterised protein [Actinomyces slackii]